MALSFPLSGSEFWGGLSVASAQLYLQEAMQMSQTAGGALLTASLGERLWRGEAALGLQSFQNAAADDAKLSILREPGRSFFVYPLRKAFPKNDPTGTILASSTITINSLPAGNREITLAGLPSGFVVAAGDYLSFVYGGKYAFHQIVTGATANGSGITGAMEVTPNIRAGASTGLTVQLIRPFFRAIVMPGSYQPWGLGPGGGRGLSFSFIQTLKA